MLIKNMPCIRSTVVLNATCFPDPAFCAALCDLLHHQPGTKVTRTELRRITSLRVSDLGIESLKGLQYLPALTELWCCSNRLTHLDTSGNPALTTLVCEYNQLERLNVRNNPALRTLVCNNNLLSRLDLSGNPHLTELLCENNLLVGLNLTNNPQLRQLWCSCNRIKTLNTRANLRLRDLQAERTDERLFV